MICGATTNFLQDNSYQLILPRFPNVQYYSTDFVVPEISLGIATAPTPYVDLRFAGDKPAFAPMTFNFLVDENMHNYQEVLDWINGIGFSSDYKDFSSFKNKSSVQPLGEQDAKVVIMSSKSNPLRSITFFDAIPIALSGFSMTSQNSQTTYVKASLTMIYTRFEFDKN